MKDASVRTMFNSILGYMRSFEEMKTIGERLGKVDTLEGMLALSGELATCHERAAKALRDLDQLKVQT